MALLEEHIALTQNAFDSLPEYSMSIPTGTTIGKKWKRNQMWHLRDDTKAKWYMGEYVEHEDPELTGICWKKIVIREAGLNVNDLKTEE